MSYTKDSSVQSKPFLPCPRLLFSALLFAPLSATVDPPNTLSLELSDGPPLLLPLWSSTGSTGPVPKMSLDLGLVLPPLCTGSTPKMLLPPPPGGLKTL